MLKAHPQISSYTPFVPEPTYVIVFSDYIWEVAELISEYEELGVIWYELRSLEEGSDLEFCVRAGDCTKLTVLMTVGQYIDALIKGNL